MIINKKNIIILVISVVLFIAFLNYKENDVEVIDSSLEVNLDLKVQEDSNNIAINKTKINEAESLNFSPQDIANHRISSFVPEAASLGFQSIYPLLPAKLYLDNIEQAKDGNVNAQYWVARALKECEGVADESSFDELITENTAEDHIIKIIKARLHVCKDLLEIVTIDEIKSHSDWLLLSAVNGGKSAASWLFMLYSDKYDDKQSFAIVSNAIESDDLFLQSHVIGYLANFVPDSEVLISSWELALCNISAACNPAILRL